MPDLPNPPMGRLDAFDVGPKKLTAVPPIDDPKDQAEPNKAKLQPVKPAKTDKPKRAKNGKQEPVDFWDIKPPGLFLVYFAGGKLFGFTDLGIRLIEVLFLVCFAAVAFLSLKSEIRPRATSLLTGSPTKRGSPRKWYGRRSGRRRFSGGPN